MGSADEAAPPGRFTGTQNIKCVSGKQRIFENKKVEGKQKQVSVSDE